MTKLQLRYIRPFMPDATAPLSFHLGGAGTPRELVRPIMVARDGAGWLVIDGHRRLAAATTTGVEIPAITYPRGTEKVLLARMALAENAAHLSMAEKLIALYKTSAFLVDTPVTLPASEAALPSACAALLDAYSDLLQRPVSSRLLTRLMRVATWPTEQLSTAHERLASLEHVLPLLDLSARERRVYFELLDRIRLSAAESKRLTRLFLFARGSKNLDLNAWLDTVRHAEIEKGSDALASLTSALQPGLEAHRNRVAAILKAMKLPTGLRITAPENLEGESFSCYFRFSRPDEYERYLNVLTAAADEGTVASLIEALNGQPADKEEKRRE